MALLLEHVGELGAGRGLARTLQAHEHDDVGRAVLHEDELALGGAKQLGELVEDDLHDVLGGRQRREHLSRKALLLALGHEVLDDTEVDVGLEQGHANLAHRDIDVVLGEAALAAKLVEGICKAVGEVVEHLLLLAGLYWQCESVGAR